jgi:hypothetical protein
MYDSSSRTEKVSDFVKLNLPGRMIGSKEEASLKSVGIGVERTEDGKVRLILPPGAELDCYVPEITWACHSFGKTEDAHYQLEVVRTEGNCVGSDNNAMPAGHYSLVVKRVPLPRYLCRKDRRKEKTIVEAHNTVWCC